MQLTEQELESIKKLLLSPDETNIEMAFIIMDNNKLLKAKALRKYAKIWNRAHKKKILAYDMTPRQFFRIMSYQSETIIRNSNGFYIKPKKESLQIPIEICKWYWDFRKSNYDFVLNNGH